MKKGRGKNRAGPLKTPNSAGTAIKDQLPDFMASFSREGSMLSRAIVIASHTRTWDIEELITLMLA